MSNHNIHFHEEISKMSVLFGEKSALSGAMNMVNVLKLHTPKFLTK